MKRLGTKTTAAAIKKLAETERYTLATALSGAVNAINEIANAFAVPGGNMPQAVNSIAFLETRIALLKQLAVDGPYPNAAQSAMMKADSAKTILSGGTRLVCDNALLNKVGKL